MLGAMFFASFAGVAAATPSRTSPCSNCHGGPNVAVSAVLQSTVGSNATYNASAPGADSIAVFSGTTKRAQINAASGQFTVPTGSTYTVYAVAGPDTGDGLGSTQVSPVAVIVDSTAPTTVSDAVAAYVGKATIHLLASDNAGGSGVSNTYYKVDGSAQAQGTTVVVSSVGAHTLEFWSTDVAGNTETHRFVNFSVEAAPPATIFTPVAGASRYETAVKASQRTFAGGAECVVIATGANWPDALGGAALAAAENGPILLTDSKTLPSAVADEIARLGASRAYILGGTGAVSSTVEDALAALLGDGNITRIGGANRYATADLVAAKSVEVLNASGTYDGMAFVATGANFPDALAAAPISAAKGWPLYLAGPTGLSAGTKAAMASAGVDSVAILGGTGAISTTTENGLKTLYGSTAVTRLAGASRYDTAVAVATWGVTNAGLSWDGLAIATGANFPDALAGGVMQGLNGSVMLLTPQTALHSATATCLSARKATIREVTYLGGTGAVGTSVRTQVSALLY